MNLIIIIMVMRLRSLSLSPVSASLYLPPSLSHSKNVYLWTRSTAAVFLLTYRSNRFLFGVLLIFVNFVCLQPPESIENSPPQIAPFANQLAPGLSSSVKQLGRRPL